MKGRPGFLIAVVSAIVTFGILFATVGKPRYLDHLQHKTECSKAVGEK